MSRPGTGAKSPSRAVDPQLLVLPSPPGGLILPELPGALCKGQDPGLWFPRRGESPEPGRAICRACPARPGCLDWAVRVGEQDGVWGGASPAERARLRRASQRSRAGAAR